MVARLGQPRRDGGAHAVERHFLVRHVAIERLDLLCRGFARQRGARRLRAACRLDVARHDAAMRAGALDIGEVDPGFAGEPPCERRHDCAAGKAGRAVIALGRAHFAERLHRDGRAQWCGPLIPAQAGIRFLGSGFWACRACVEERVGAFSPGASITATTAPTGATSPAATLIAASVPAAIAGTSIDTLSVSISNRLSPGFTVAPADDEPFRDLAFSHGLAELRHQHVHVSPTLIW